MEEDYRRKLKQETKEYIELLYSSHRNEDLTAWGYLIDIIFLYCDLMIEEHEKYLHREE